MSIARTECLRCHQGADRELSAARGVDDPETRVAATIRFSH
jgi:hypothetical protein